MHPIRSLLLESLKHLAGKRRPLALQLSGGCDSVALAICLKELGYPFTCHTSYFIPRKDSNKDLTTVRKVANYLDLDYTEYPFGKRDLFKRLKKLDRLGITGKVTTQCMVGFTEMLDELPDHYILNGAGADDILWGSTKKIFLYKQAHKDPVMFRKRREELFTQKVVDHAGVVGGLVRYVKETGATMVFPYWSKKLAAWFHARSFKELKTGHDGKSRMKGQWYDAFRRDLPEDILRQVQRRAQQISNGVRDYLRDKEAGR